MLEPNSLEPNYMTISQEMVEKFMVKYLSLVLNAKKRNVITSFRQCKDESLFEA